MKENGASSELFPRTAVCHWKTLVPITLTMLATLSYAMALFYQSGQFHLIAPVKNVILPPKILPRGQFSLDQSQVPRTPGTQLAALDQNLLLKTWDKTVFNDVDSTAYKNIEVVNSTGRGTSMELTSFKMTHVELVSHVGRSIKVGDVLHYRIQSRDFNGRKRILGGDMWYATLNSDKDPKASTAGHVVDHGNGTYDAYVLAAWPGNAKFNLILVHASEAVYHLRNIVWNSERRAIWLGRYSFKGKTTDAVCYLQHHGKWEGKCEYPAYRALGSTVFLCDKKPDFPCESLYALNIHRQATSNRAKELGNGMEYLYKRPYFEQGVPVTNSTLRIEGSGLEHNKLPRCKADQPIPTIQGYWMNDKWNSLLCEFGTWTEKSSLTSCLRGQRLVILGDSTMNQWLNGLIKLLDTATVDKPGKRLWSKMHYDSLNLTLYFQFHPYVIGSHTYKLNEMREEVDVLNGLNDADCNYVVVISPWAHFAQWTRDSYIERVRLIRKAVIDLRHRCPDIPFVIKGPHPRDHKSWEAAMFISDYILTQIETINREAFGGIGAFFLPIWDMNLAYPARKNVHMPMTVIMEELKMFVGYVCDTLHPH
ncbi:NXPE family member 3-like [Patiria miniata]|uniref:NXPE C-terminal domain-containing protein n=1 Tax=Patiria miniata TaxID=46514 RepID=A0A914BIP7_PATMI|nr:NXPE family member 3-like [Patiria miniata]